MMMLAVGSVGGRRPTVGLYLLLSPLIFVVLVARLHVSQSAVSLRHHRRRRHEFVVLLHNERSVA